MQPFTTLTAIAAPLDLVNIDTDMIIPKQFLRTIKRTGLGVNLFNDMRFDEQGNEIPDFILNREPWRQAQILVAGANFGCGSSREHAPWALLDFGVRCVIAESFADIFYNNCSKNGILAAVTPAADVTAFMNDAKAGRKLTVDLEAQKIAGGSRVARFEIDAHRKRCLLGGLDDIGLTLEKESAITAYEDRDRQAKPWLWTER